MVEQANEVCRRLNTEFAEDKPKSASFAEIARIVPHRVTLEARAVRDLSRLTPPASMAHAWRQIIAYRQILATELVQLVRYARARDAAGIKALTLSKAGIHKKLAALALGHGLPDCSRTG